MFHETCFMKQLPNLMILNKIFDFKVFYEVMTFMTLVKQVPFSIRYPLH